MLLGRNTHSISICKNTQHHCVTAGHLVLDFLLDRSTPLEYSQKVMEYGHQYNGYSLITGTLKLVKTTAQVLLYLMLGYYQFNYRS